MSLDDMRLDAMRPDALPTEATVLARLTAWAAAQPAVRALLLTSSRARPDGPVDALSDYDVIVVVREPAALARDDAWLSDYGQPLARWGDQGSEAGLATYFRSAVYADFVKIDYTLWPAALLERLAAEAALPPELDAGYRVLLDKDGHTRAWPPPTYRAFRPQPPTAAGFLALVEEFWWVSSYVAKALWRDELVFARWCLDNDLKLGALRRLLEWRVALEHGWDQRPGVLGRGLKQRLPAHLWRQLEATYVGPAPDANWQALLQTVDLFAQVAREVAAAFRFDYPAALEARFRAYIATVRAWPRPPAGS